MMNEMKIRAYLEKEKIDAFFVAKRVNVRFTSGWTGDDSFILLTKDGQFFLTDPRYTEQADIEVPNYEIINWRLPGKTVGDTVARLAEEKDIKTIAFEADYLTYDMYTDFNEKTPAEFIQAGGVIDKMRAIKSPQEIQYMRNACEISCRAFEHILEDIKVGVTEKELAAKLSLYMVQEGADTQPYGNILISGANTSLLHGIPSKKAVEYGDFVLMDFGCQYNGYMSDMTRTVVVGKASDKQREVYEYERQSLEAAETVMKNGVAVRDVYQASLKPLEGTEYPQYTYRNIGHSIGLFVHELPYIDEQYEDVLETGMVMTIEPGIYIPDWGGVRIEDQVLITDDGYENMISISHDLIEL
ncbi:M24 family metallopeptidase [Candidatus Enterococcus ferrettii]|uniref:Xaa-Pro aminopeptidase n=1 Tax=Candidatus Enterococcus ferrettii TaxID=2815324 RepID=A0ABV0EV30_9ENTE|nr:Xaa-Pro peptidase family protein [Enterococcus sp. 665A]MBO1340542.1 aminopeptidase P family protein [Enterococcus sp. 665A]